MDIAKDLSDQLKIKRAEDDSLSKVFEDGDIIVLLFSPKQTIKFFQEIIHFTSKKHKAPLNQYTLRIFYLIFFKNLYALVGFCQEKKNTFMSAIELKTSTLYLLSHICHLF